MHRYNGCIGKILSIHKTLLLCQESFFANYDRKHTNYDNATYLLYKGACGFFGKRGKTAYNFALNCGYIFGDLCILCETVV